MSIRSPIRPLARRWANNHDTGATSREATGPLRRELIREQPRAASGKTRGKEHGPIERLIGIAPRRPLIALTAFVMFLLLLSQPLRAQTQTVDFEQFTGPNTWVPLQPPVTVGIATFSGGHLLDETLSLPADQTTVYGTATPLFGCTGCSSTIFIDFSQAVSNVSLKVVNGQTFTVQYTVNVQDGSNPQVFFLVSNGESGQTTVTLPHTGVTQVQVTSNAENWNFFIDDVQFAVQESAPVITTVAAGLNFPFGVAVDNGNVYIADRNNHKVWKLSGETLTRVAGTQTGEAGYNGDGISATTAQLNSPTGLRWRMGTCSSRIRAATSSVESVSPVELSPRGGDTAEEWSGRERRTRLRSTELFGPRGVATASGNLYIADTMNQQIRKVDLGTGIITAVAGVAGDARQR